MPSLEGDDNDVPPIGFGVLGRSVSVDGVVGHSNFGSCLSYSSR
jgi:hypothetical protein